MICKTPSTLPTRSSAPGAGANPRAPRSGARAHLSLTSSGKTWPNFAQRSSAQIGLSRTKSATRQLLLRQRSGPGRGAVKPPPPGPAKAPSKICRSTSWPVWSVIQSKARWNNSVFCVTRRGVLLRPLNSNSMQTFRVGHSGYFSRKGRQGGLTERDADSRQSGSSCRDRRR